MNEHVAFEHAIGRFARRTSIENQMRELKRVSDYVGILIDERMPSLRDLEVPESSEHLRARAKENSNDVLGVARRIVQKGFAENGMHMHAIEEIQYALERDIAQLKNPAVVLLGSGARGGALLDVLFKRESIIQAQPRDLDFAVLYDEVYGAAQDLGSHINLVAKKTLSPKHIPLKLCGTMNPKMPILLSRNFQNPTEAEKSLLEIYGASANLISAVSVPRLLSRVHMFFSATYPSSVREKNVEMILSGMRMIYHRDPEAWQWLVENISSSVPNELFKVGIHSPQSENRKTVLLAQEVNKMYSEMVTKRMRNLLESTKS